MTMLLLGLALAQEAPKKFDGELRTLELDETGGPGGAPAGMAFIVPPGTVVEAYAGSLGGDDKGLRLTVRQAGDALACTSPIPATGSIFVKAKVRLSEISAGPAVWHGLNLEVRARNVNGALLASGGAPYVLLANLREPTDWTTVESKGNLPPGTANAEICLRFVHSTGVLELDRLQIVAPKGDPSVVAGLPSLPPALPLPPASVASAPQPAGLPPAVVVGTATTPTGVVTPSGYAAPQAALPVAQPAEPSSSRSSRKASAKGSGASEGGVALRMDHPGSALACGPWMTAGSFRVDGTLDVVANGAPPPDWSGVLVEAVAQDEAGRPVSAAGGPSTPLFSVYEPARDRTFEANYSSPNSASRTRVCVRFNAASGNAEINVKAR